MSKNDRITIRVTKQQLKRLDEYLTTNKTTKSTFFRKILDDKLNNLSGNRGIENIN